jgi:HAD superfamily hydrolase (TIGR01549 family)
VKKSNRIQGVIFDLDGTLYSLKMRHARMALALWSSLHILRHLKGVRGWIRMQTFQDRDSLHCAFCEELGRRAGIPAGKADEWYRTKFMFEFIRMLGRDAVARPGLVSLCTKLREYGVKLAVVSDYGFVDERIIALRIPLEIFDGLYASEDYGVLKPSPKPLLALAREWGIEAGNMVMIGDRMDRDGVCAKAAGMEFIGISDSLLAARNGLVSWPEAQRRLFGRSRQQ